MPNLALSIDMYASIMQAAATEWSRSHIDGVFLI